MFSLQSGAEEFDLYVNTEWNFFTEIVRGVFQEQFQRCCYLPSPGQHSDFVQFPKSGKSGKFTEPNFKKFPIGSNIGMLYIIFTGFLPRLRILRTLKFFSHFGKATEVKVLPVYRTYSQQCVFILLENCVKKRSEDMLLQC